MSTRVDDSRITGHSKTSCALRAYSANGAAPCQEDLVRQYLPLVNSIAHRASAYLRPPLSFEDLVSAGVLGLIKAARDYDASKGAGFKTYAYIRIKGAILDELRRAAMLPPATNRQVKEAMDLSRRIMEQTGAAPTDQQLADGLGIDIEQLYQLMDHARAQYFVSTDGKIDDGPTLGQSLSAPTSTMPDHCLEREELLEALTKAIMDLDEKRRQVVILYYHQHMTMRQIAEVLGITESRVSQLHASALFTLSVTLRAWRDEQF
ncbi:MAG: FliA/WhiG family RNA polymerase sigma factor [Sedimentisphaerales bacterium]|nr:FliA/WhiG family RNA polymerase sigma factor [Sedimentisphaerales bacterium]